MFPDSTGTHIWKFSDDHWTKHLLLSEKVHAQADCYATSDTVFILLFQDDASASTVVKFDELRRQYAFLDPTRPLTPIAFTVDTETATIALDGKSTLWMTYEAKQNIEVRTSTPPYDHWSSPQRIGSSVANDDISAIIRMSNSIGILWSNQRTQRFGFRVHRDGDPIDAWSPDELPAGQDAIDVGEGMADDHINMKYLPDGTLFAAVKTSYDTPEYTKIGLLVRRPSGAWDDLHHVSYTGTRPMVTVDTGCNLLNVYYTHVESGGDIVVKKSPLDTISFGKEIPLLRGQNYNNVTSTKFPYDCQNIVLASGNGHVVSNLIKCGCP